MRKYARMWLIITIGVALVACDNSDDNGITDDTNQPPSDGEQLSDEVPPQGEQAIDEWLATEAYLDWACELEPNTTREGVHGVNLVCSNNAVANNTEGDDPWPIGAAAVKELYDSDGLDIIGYAVSIKTEMDSAGGSNWYWYEKIDGNLIVDGLDERLCADCHEMASRDLMYVTVSAN
ncbi:MAG: hypothetical protein KTR25_18895 [Myxococcales bacterium]|nr:hypothetical protein [Myxococcales bacterium]